jgi:hypothetical protein
MLAILTILFSLWAVAPLLESAAKQTRRTVKMVREKPVKVKPELPTVQYEKTYDGKGMVSATADEVDKWLKKNPDLKISETKRG